MELDRTRSSTESTESTEMSNTLECEKDQHTYIKKTGDKNYFQVTQNRYIERFDKKCMIAAKNLLIYIKQKKSKTYLKNIHTKLNF